MAEVREPSPDEDVIAAERVILRDCLTAAEARPRDVADFMAGAAKAVLTARSSFVPASRLAAVEAELAEMVGLMQGFRSRAHAAEDALDRARRLVEYAWHLRRHGENAPGGNETWAEWDGRSEAWLRRSDFGAALAGPPAPKETDA